MTAKGKSKDEAVAFVKAKRREAFFPEANFDRALAAFARKQD